MNVTRNNRSASMNLEPLEGRQMMAAGDLDTTFGVGGKVIAEAVGYPAADIAVQKDGKYVVVGSLNGDFAVTRFNPDGKPDPTFGGGGFVRTNFGGAEGDFANAVAIQPDGKIVVVGRHQADDPDDNRFAIVRLNRNGSPDSSFDGDGKRTIDFDRSSANAVAIQPDGKILVAGVADAGIVNLNDDFAVARLLPNGSLDNTFGDGRLLSSKRTGKTTIDFGADTQGEQALAVAVAPDGKIVLGGMGGNGVVERSQKFAVTRLNSNGTIDRFFGDGISGAGRFNNVLHFAEFRDLHVAENRSITIVGGVNGNFLTMRLTPAGRLDKQFNGTGHLETNMGGNDDAKHVLVNAEGILVAGVSSGKFAMARFRFNGEPDSSFGKGGKVVTKVGADDAILTTRMTPDGKLLAYGRSGSSARYIAAVPTVTVTAGIPAGTERGNNPASLVFKRGVPQSFPTRVFYSLGGTATLGEDYTGPIELKPGSTTGATGLTAAANLQPIGGGIVGAPVAFVDIPANETSVVVPIIIIDDAKMEPIETVLASVRSNPAYTVGNLATRRIEIADNDPLLVNFQPTPSPFAFAYEPDLGLPFGARPNGQQFGWDVDNTANARTRSSSGLGFIYDTFNHMQKPGGGSKWEIALPNGLYQVKLAAGDRDGADSVYRMNLEGTPAVVGTPSDNVRWFERTINVMVNDGRLTLTNGAGARNNKVAYIEVRPAPPGGQPGAVTGNVPVRVSRTTPGTLPTGESTFSQLRI